jgi:two-component system chemotaxis sensor kinase CheA
MDDQLLREFLAEAEDLIEDLYGDIALLRERRADGRARRELVDRIFRHVHTIKGTAAAAGLDSASALAHEFESLLDAVRLGRVGVGDAVLDAFAEAVDAVAADLAAVARGERAAAPRGLAERLRRLASPEGAPSSSPETSEAGAEASLPEEIARTLSGFERQRLREALGEGARTFVVAVDFELETFDEQFRQLSDALAERGEVVATLPGADASAPDRVSFRIVHATDEGRAEVLARVRPFGATLLEDPKDARRGAATRAGAGGTGAEEEKKRKEGEPGANEVRRAAPEEESEGGVGLPASASSLTMLVRVPLDELDDLISAAHELFTDTAGTLDLALAGALGRAERTELEIRAPRIRRRFFELEERLIELRMVPVRATLERAARAGQSVARAAGKDVAFEVAGGEVRLDKSLAEKIADPLLHLLRNAVDHGVEPAGERAAAGKAARGLVRLEAAAEGSRVLLRVSDDGRGVDPARVARAARERGLVRDEQEVGAEQALRLIFRPGFSTAADVSTVSGRGVGLDVVERNVEEAGGELRVWSEPGRGTTFEMRLPTTLALVPSLVVRSAGHRYCVDASHVVEAGYVAREAVEREGERETVRWRGVELPVVHLRALLAQEPRAGEGDERLAVVVAGAGGGRCGRCCRRTGGGRR